MKTECRCISYTHTRGYRACRYGKPIKARTISILQMRFDGLSTGDIAEAFGVSESRIVKYFGEAKNYFESNDIRTVCFKAHIRGWIS